MGTTTTTPAQKNETTVSEEGSESSGGSPTPSENKRVKKTTQGIMREEERDYERMLAQKESVIDRFRERVMTLEAEVEKLQSQGTEVILESLNTERLRN